MKKYAFADCDTISQALGIEDKRFEEIKQAAVDTALGAYLFDKNIDKPSKALEVLINLVQPKSEVEAMFAGYVFSEIEAKASKLAKGIVKQSRAKARNQGGLFLSPAR